MEVRFEPLVGELVEVREVSNIHALLLVERRQEVVYCWLEGELWVRRVRQFQPGQHISLSAYRWYPVSPDTAEMYTPAIPGKTVASGYIHVAASDPDFRIVPQTDFTYVSLKSALEDASSNPWTHRDLVGTVLDVYLRVYGEDQVLTLKITDESQAMVTCSGLVVRGKQGLGVESVGDLVVLHGCVWGVYGSQPHINRVTSGWAVYHHSTSHLLSSFGRYQAKSHTLNRLKDLQTWTRTYYSLHSICKPHEIVPNLGSLTRFSFKSIHIIGQIIAIQPDFPSKKVTILIADETGWIQVEIDGKMEWMQVGKWVKLCNCRVEKGQKVTNCSYILEIEESYFDVKTHVRNYHVLGRVIALEAMESIRKQVIASDSLRQKLITRCTHPSLPLWTAPEVLSPLSFRKYTRLKAIFIDIQPSDLISGFQFITNQWHFSGLIRVFSEKSLISILLTESELAKLMNFSTISPDNIEEIDKMVEKLKWGGSVMEIGLWRVVWGRQVLLKMYHTQAVMEI